MHIHFYDTPWEGGQDQGYQGPGWYFWDETQSDCVGPYPSRRKAEEATERYGRYLGLTGSPRRPDFTCLVRTSSYFGATPADALLNAAGHPRFNRGESGGVSRGPFEPVSLSYSEAKGVFVASVTEEWAADADELREELARLSLGDAP